MINLNEIITQIPINIYVVIGCCVVGWLMKKFLPTDNKIIPLTLTILGAIIFVIIEGISAQNIIVGAFTGSAATGLHQIYSQLIEGKDLAMTNGDGTHAEDAETEVEDDEEGDE